MSGFEFLTAEDWNALIARLEALEASQIQSGMILKWAGTIANIPDGWVICDGNNGTPNLLDKFVKGVLTAATDPGATGGADGHNHSGNTLEPSLGFTRVSSRPDKGPYEYQTVIGTSTRSSQSSWWGSTSWVGHDPEYYAVAYLMKT